jgi:hypothetical protein
MKLEYILLFIIIFIAVFIFLYTLLKSDIWSNKPTVEPMAMPPMIPGNNSYGMNVSTISNLRSFLEQTYLITNKDENVDSSFNFCNKISGLASWLASTIGNIEKRSMEDIFAAYGGAGVPKTDENDTGMPETIPLINNHMDYIQLLNLAVRGSVLEPYNEPHVAIVDKLNLKVKKFYKDLSNGFVSYLDMGLIDSANAQYMPIQRILRHFHNQLSEKDKVYPGDTYDTALVPDGTQCNLYKPITLNYKNFNEFSTPGSGNGVVPFWAKKIRVLIVGAGGGGGGGGGYCYTRSKKYREAGGGGGAGGNSGMVIFTDMYDVAPRTPFSVHVGAGGAGGAISTKGGDGGITSFNIGSDYINVGGSFGGGGGNGGECSKDVGNGGVIQSIPAKISIKEGFTEEFTEGFIFRKSKQTAKPTQTIKPIDVEITGKFKFKSLESNWGTMGVRANANGGKYISDVTGGHPGKGGKIRDFRDWSPSELNELEYVLSTYGFSGNGGAGTSQDYAANNYVAQPGTNGGGGYVRVFFYE